MRATCRSFRQTWGSNAPLYAADVVYAATALLEAPPVSRPGEAARAEDKSDQFWCAAAAPFSFVLTTAVWCALLPLFRSY